MGNLSHLDELEAEAIYIIREVAAELLFDKIMGKASGRPREILLDTELVVRKSVKRLL